MTTPTPNTMTKPTLSNKKEMETVKMTFTVEVPFDIMIDRECFQKEFHGNVLDVAKLLYKEEGHWWDEKMILESAEIKTIKP